MRAQNMGGNNDTQQDPLLGQSSVGKRQISPKILHRSDIASNLKEEKPGDEMRDLSKRFKTRAWETKMSY